MKTLTRGQLNIVLNSAYKNDVDRISKEDIERLFEKYGDEYYCEYGYGAPWELCIENEAWTDVRGKYAWCPVRSDGHVPG